MGLIRYDYDYQEAPAEQWDSCFQFLESISDTGAHYSLNPPRTGYVLIDESLDLSSVNMPSFIHLTQVD